MKWRRVIVDEVQDVEGQASAAGYVLRSLDTLQRWGVSGTCIANGLDALKGLAVFLGISPYCQDHWWKENVEINKFSTNAEREARMVNLVDFASRHMWRTRHSDIGSEHQMPPQIHEPPLLITPSQSEFAVLYPNLKEIASAILTEVKRFGWNEHDQTPLSNKDLKQLLGSNGSGTNTNSMYRAAVSVSLIGQVSSRSSWRGGKIVTIAKPQKKNKSEMNKIATSAADEVRLNHSQWRK
eukprot:CAMPEP_0114384170 /NCGR_PEP_ID=MMETSP0102-20121206/5196_1 /TAXON_ID=38822 ORGANISM="Pteridomonas danica, Strain PT" /NCGR_SAMPLE_ID=MMETSP0102 /ASSEMBLY_ACC=CAM_ASM_000212 /LENGTH=238 /DNA_ID=CAMNT_0001540413 /DNA_START=253 /DNA_END=966 /DNA_ORIENTATION=+